MHTLVAAGHTVLVEHNAGELSALPDDEYQAAGAEIVGGAHDVWRLADMVVKVKEPVEKEYRHFREGLVLFTYLHLAPLAALTDALLSNKVTGIAYETVRDRAGTLPLLTPMSEVAGRMSVQVGAAYLEKEHGGRGVLLGGVPGVPPGTVVILGGGIVGTNAAKIALGLGARVTLIDLNLNRLRELDDIFGGRLFTLASNAYNIGRAVCDADLVIGGVLIPGAAAPKLVTKAMVSKMKKGAVIVDVAIDQGGCIETARPTTHSDPSYRGRWRCPLLRHQYARGGAQYLDAGADQRDLPLPVEAGEARRERGHQGRRRYRRGRQYLQRRLDVQGCRGVAEARVAAGWGAGVAHQDAASPRQPSSGLLL